MTLPPLNTPIPHNGSPECPVHPDTRVSGNYLWATAFKSAAGLVDWRNVTTYTIIARAPADEIAALQARVAELEGENAALRKACEPFDKTGGQLFRANANASDVVFFNGPGATLTFAAFLDLRAALKGNPNAHD